MRACACACFFKAHSYVHPSANIAPPPSPSPLPPPRHYNPSHLLPLHTLTSITALQTYLSTPPTPASTSKLLETLFPPSTRPPNLSPSTLEKLSSLASKGHAARSGGGRISHLSHLLGLSERVCQQLSFVRACCGALERCGVFGGGEGPGSREEVEGEAGRETFEINVDGVFQRERWMSKGY